MSLTESDVNVLKSMFVDEIGKAMQASDDRLGVRLANLGSGLRSEIRELSGKVDGLTGQVGLVLDRLTVVEGDISAMRAQLAGLARVDAQRRLEKLEARMAELEPRLDALEGARQ
jgi:hypothetical protein